MPLSVPTYKSFVRASTTMHHVGRSGRPLLMSVQVRPASVLLSTCFTLGVGVLTVPAKAPIDRYTVSRLEGSTAKPVIIWFVPTMDPRPRLLDQVKPPSLVTKTLMLVPRLLSA